MWHTAAFLDSETGALPVKSDGEKGCVPTFTPSYWRCAAHALRILTVFMGFALTK